MDDGRLELIDGHLRRSLDPDQVLPVLVLDVTEAEADSLLATLDPLASLAGAEPGALRDLLSRVETSSEEVRRLFAELLAGAGQVRTEYEGRHERTYGPDEGRSGCR